MTKRTWKQVRFAVALLALCVPTVLAQEKPKADPAKPPAENREAAKPEPPSQGPETQPDDKAYSAAMDIADPEQQIAALAKFIADFPDSWGVSFARRKIVSVTVKHWPERKDQILARANELIGASGEDKSSAFNFVAAQLLDAGIFLDEAEAFALKGVDALDEKQFRESQTKLAETDKRPVPSDGEIAARFRTARARNLATLGSVQLKRGKTAEARDRLLEAYEANRSLPDVSVGLAALAEKEGNQRAEIEYLAAAVLTGRAPDTAHQRLEALYRQGHDGALDGLEAMLDAKYKEMFPLPMVVEHYKPSATRTRRVVLAEVFTGAACPPCVAADLAFDALLERYSRNDLAVVMYHQHIPRPDPMTNPSTQARRKFYQLGSVPSMVIDGHRQTGGGPRDATRRVYDRIAPEIEARLEADAEASLSLDAERTGGRVKVEASVSDVKSESSELKLHLALVEEALRYTGENGIRFHPMVVRSLAGPEAAGFAVDPSKTTRVEHTFDLAKIMTELKQHLDDVETGKKSTFRRKLHEIDPQNLSVVAFVQDQQSKQVLQAAYLGVKSLEEVSGQ